MKPFSRTLRLKQMSWGELQLSFETNKNLVSSPLLLWTAHKCYIRGVLIKHGHRVKQDKAQTLTSLLSKLHVLEKQNKPCPDHLAAVGLNRLREQIRDLSLFQAKKRLLKAHRTFYEFGDKCSRSLANAIRTRRNSSYIAAIPTRSGTKINSSPEMAETFCDFYDSLYSL